MRAPAEGDFYDLTPLIQQEAWKLVVHAQDVKALG